MAMPAGEGHEHAGDVTGQEDDVEQRARDTGTHRERMTPRQPKVKTVRLDPVFEMNGYPFFHCFTHIPSSDNVNLDIGGYESALVVVVHMRPSKAWARAKVVERPPSRSTLQDI